MQVYFLCSAKFFALIILRRQIFQVITSYYKRIIHKYFLLNRNIVRNQFVYKQDNNNIKCVTLHLTLAGSHVQSSHSLDSIFSVLKVKTCVKNQQSEKI